MSPTDSDIEVMADFKMVPDTPFWEMPGFLFDAETVEEIQEHKKKIWKALICPDYTSVPKGSRNRANPEEITKTRVQNNIALLFRALLFFSDHHPSPSYWKDLSPDTFSGCGETTIKLLEGIFVHARRAYADSKGRRRRSNVAMYADKYISFLDWAGGDVSTSDLSKVELRDSWAELKKKGALFNLAQHRPNDVEDDSTDEEPLTLPGESLEQHKSKKRKKTTSGPVTPRKSTRRSSVSGPSKPSADPSKTSTGPSRTGPPTSSTRPSIRSVRVVSPSSSPPTLRFDSSVGLSSEISTAETVSSPILGSALANNGDTQREPLKKVHQRMRVIDITIGEHSDILASHTNAIESLRADIGLHKGGKAAGLVSTVAEAVAGVLEKKKQSYITHVAAAKVNAAKGPLEEKLATLDSKILDYVGKIAVAESKRSDMETKLDRVSKKLELMGSTSGHEKLQKKVKRYRDDHKSLARDVTSRLLKLERNVDRSGPAGAAEESEEDEDRQNHARSNDSRFAMLEKQIADLKQVNVSLTKRVADLEKGNEAGQRRDNYYSRDNYDNRDSHQRRDSYNTSMVGLNRGSRPNGQMNNGQGIRRC